MTPRQPSAGERYVRVAEKLPAGRVSEADWRNVPALVKRYRQNVVALAHDDPFGMLLAASYGFDRYLWEDPIGRRPAGARTASAFPLRPVPSAGGLGSAEIYLLLGPGHRIPAGAYHYDAARHALDTLWTGDGVASLGGGQPRLVLTAVVGRVQWKYGDFGYRLQCLDAGVLAAQLEIAARLQGMSVHHDPWASDPVVEQALGLDTLAETVQAVLTVDDGGPPAPAPSGRAPVPTRVARATPRTTPRPALPRMPAAHDLCASIRAESAGPPPAWPEPPALTGYAEVKPLESIDVPPASAPRIAHTRRSLRGRFGAERLSAADLFDVLRSAGTGWGGDHLLLGCLVHNVAELAAGAYLYDHGRAKLHHLSAADLRIPIGPRQLSIAWMEGDPAAAAVLVPVGDYPAGFATVGDRWYRLLNLAAGAAAHRGTLAAHALGLTSRLICAFDVDTYATALRLGGGPLRPLLAVRLGPAGPVSAIEHRFHDEMPDEVLPSYGSEW